MTLEENLEIIKKLENEVEDNKYVNSQFKTLKNMRIVAEESEKYPIEQPTFIIDEDKKFFKATWSCDDFIYGYRIELIYYRSNQYVCVFNEETVSQSYKKFDSMQSAIYNVYIEIESIFEVPSFENCCKECV